MHRRAWVVRAMQPKHGLWSKTWGTLRRPRPPSHGRPLHGVGHLRFTTPLGTNSSASPLHPVKQRSLLLISPPPLQQVTEPRPNPHSRCAWEVEKMLSANPCRLFSHPKNSSLTQTINAHSPSPHSPGTSPARCPATG